MSEFEKKKRAIYFALYVKEKNLNGSDILVKSQSTDFSEIAVPCECLPGEFIEC